MFAGSSEAVGAAAFCAPASDSEQNTNKLALSLRIDGSRNEQRILYRRLLRDAEDLGASAVEFRRTNVVVITYSVLPGAGTGFSLSLTRA